MPSPLPLLRSWWKEERRLLPALSLLRGVALATGLLLVVLVALETRRRNAAIHAAIGEQRLQRVELLAASLDDIRRTAFDWARWNDTRAFIEGTNPGFIERDMAQSSLFSSGGVMVLFDRQGDPRVTHSQEGTNQPAHLPLQRCAQSNLRALRNLRSTIRLFCRGEAGRPYLGVLTQISNNDSSAPTNGSLVMFEPLIRPAHGPKLRQELQSLAGQMTVGRAPGSEDPLPSRFTLFGDGGGAIALRRQSTLRELALSWRDDGVLILVFLAPLLLARIRLTLAHRDQRLQDLRGERRATIRIRRVCHQLDALLSQLGLDGDSSNAQQRVMAQLISPDAPESTATPEPLALEKRLDAFGRRFQHFLDGARSLALLDTLTQLPNRRFFVEQLELEVQRHREKGTPIALLFVDIDKFKEINDSFGHSAGDRALVLVGERLRRLINRDDFLARYGGDEFVILHELIPAVGDDHKTQQTASLRFAERIATAFEGPFDLDGTTIALSLSLGITLLHPDLAQPEVAIQQCDLAMLEAKRNKHDRIAIFNLDNENANDNDYELYTDLLEAIREHQLSVHFQPIVDREGRACGVEALARWQHPQRGAIVPDLFVSLAERHRQIHRLGDELLRQTLEGYRNIRQAPGQPLELSFNISPSQLEDPSLVSRILHQLSVQSFPPGRLTLELTERSILNGSSIVRDNLQQLRAHGIRLSLDDFGTGQSSLSLLSSLQPDEVKIDRSFVVTMSSDPYARQIIALLCRMAQALGFDLVAEGVEEEAVFQQLRGLGVQRFQGYWFARPLEASAVDAGTTLPSFASR